MATPEVITDGKLPSLKQESQSNRLVKSKDNQLDNAVSVLSDAIIELGNRPNSEKEVANALLNLKSDFIDSNTLNSDNLEKSLTMLHQDLLAQKSSTDTFIDSQLKANEYLSKQDKAQYEDSLTRASSVEELMKIKSEITGQSVDSKFLIKTLSAVRNGIEKSTDLGKDESSALLKEVDAIGVQFYQTGEVNNSAILDVVRNVSSKKNEDGSSKVKIDSESQVLKSIDQRVLKNILIGAKQSGDTDLSKLSLTMTQLDSHLGGVIQDLDKSSQLKIQQLTESFGASQITLEEHSKSVRDVVISNGITDQESLSKLGKLETHLSVINKNTDPKTDKLSNADKILKQNEQEIAQENNEALQGLLNGIKTKDNVAVKSSVLAGVSSAEDAGEAATDTAIDFLLEKAMGGKKKGKSRGRKGGRGKGGALGKLLGKGAGLASAAKGGLGLAKGIGGTALKAAGPLGAIAATGMSAYDIFAAEDDAEQKEAVGSTAGAVIGGALGAFGGPLGIMAGAALGNWIGGKVGTWFTSPDDFIPDKIKGLGPEAELKYINEVLEPSIKAEMTKADGKYTAEDLADLQKYKSGLQTKVGTQAKANVNAGLDDNQAAQVDNLIVQGMTNAAQIAASTGLPIDLVNKRLKGGSQFSPTSADYNTNGLNKSDKTSQQVSGGNSMSVTQVSGGGDSGSDRISDQSVNLLAHMV